MAYDDVPNDEAVDLVMMLPPGTRYRARISAEDAWSVDRELLAQLIDKVDLRIAQAAGNIEKCHTRVTRPVDVERRVEDARRRAKVREQIKNTKWVAVEPPEEEPERGDS